MGKLGQLLVARGWITVQQLTRALKNQNVVGGRLGTCLLEMEVLGEELLARSLSEQLGVPAGDIEDLRAIPDEVLSLIPEKLARRCRAIPFRVAGGRLDVVMQDPRNLVCQDEIAFACGRRVKVHVLHELRIQEALQRYYREECPSRYSLLIDRLNRARYLWSNTGRKAGTAADANGDSTEVLSRLPADDLLGGPPRFAPSPLPEPALPPRPRRAWRAPAGAAALSSAAAPPAPPPTSPDALPPLAELDLRATPRRQRALDASGQPVVPPEAPREGEASSALGAPPPPEVAAEAIPAAADLPLPLPPLPPLPPIGAETPPSAAETPAIAALAPPPIAAPPPSLAPPAPAIAALSALSALPAVAATPAAAAAATDLDTTLVLRPPPSTAARPAPRRATSAAQLAAAPPPAAAPRTAPSAPSAPHEVVTLSDAERADLALASPPPAGPQPPREAPATLAEVEEALVATTDREEVGRILLGFLARSFRRVALFQAGRGGMTAWMAHGDDIDQEAFARYSVDFKQPSIFLNLREGSGFHIGPLAPMESHRELTLCWGGGLPRDCLALPVRLRDRLVLVVYLDGGNRGLGGVDIEQMRRLTTLAAAAFERCILQKKRGYAQS